MAKFKAAINDKLSDKTCDKVIDYVMNIEKLEDITPMMSLFYV